MINPINEFSNFDVYTIVKELDIILSKGIISNIYEVQDLIILKINTHEGNKNLIIKKDSRINLTEYDYPIPKYPSQYIMSLRKLLKNRRILKIFQHNFDRIILLELSNTDGDSWKFIIELFNKGNYLVLDENNIIKIAKKYVKFKDRDLLPNKEYNFPSSRGTDFLNIDQKEFKSLLTSDKDIELVRYLARNINIAGFYSEEVCYRAGLDKKVLIKDLSNEQIEVIYKAFKGLRNDLLFKNVNAQIIFSKNSSPICVVPFELKLFEDYQKKSFETFNKAVDYFYSKLDSEKVIAPSDKKVDDAINAQKRILENQKNYLEALQIKKKKYYTYGDFIYNNFNKFEKLILIISEAINKGYNLEEINNRLKQAKKQKFEDIKFFDSIDPKSKQIVIKINSEDDPISLDLNRTLGENANIIYSKGKKIKKKIKGTLAAIKKTELKINKLKLEKQSMGEKVDFLVKKPKKKWYEKFRWFLSSDGFLIIGGRDASSNEAIFKKYLEPDDLVFHTTFPGSPLTVIKNPKNVQIPETTINETAQFVASYSRAWKENWGVIDVFFVKSDQISKSPPSGEYLSKGSFIISGKKKFIKNVKTELAIGIEFKQVEGGSSGDLVNLYPKIISGPPSAIKKNTENYILIKPSKSIGLSKSKLANEIKSYFVRNVDTELRKWAKLLVIDDILLYLPTGLSTIKN